MCQNVSLILCWEGLARQKFDFLFQRILARPHHAPTNPAKQCLGINKTLWLRGHILQPVEKSKTRKPTDEVKVIKGAVEVIKLGLTAQIVSLIGSNLEPKSLVVHIKLIIIQNYVIWQILALPSLHSSIQSMFNF